MEAATFPVWREGTQELGDSAEWESHTVSEESVTDSEDLKHASE